MRAAWSGGFVGNNGIQIFNREGIEGRQVVRESVRFLYPIFSFFLFPVGEIACRPKTDALTPLGSQAPTSMYL